MSRLVSYEIDPDDPYPNRFTGHVRVETRDGRVFEARQDHIRGGVEEPLSHADVEAKFLANARHGGVAQGEELLALCRTLLRSKDAAARIAGFAVNDR